MSRIGDVSGYPVPLDSCGLSFWGIEIGRQSMQGGNQHAPLDARSLPPYFNSSRTSSLSHLAYSLALFAKVIALLAAATASFA